MAAPSEAAVAAREIAELQRAAQERLALIAALATVDEWRNVHQQGGVTTVMPRLRDFVGTLRKVSHRLTARYYNLVRSIEVGYALPNPYGNPFGPNVTIDQLYNELGDVLREVIHDPTGHTRAAPLRSRPDVGDQGTGVDREDDLDEKLAELEDDLQGLFDSLREKYEPLFDREIPVDEDFKWPDVVTDDFRALDREVRAEAKALANRIRILSRDENATPEHLAVQVREQQRLSGFIASGPVGQEAIQSGRTLTERLIRKDKRVKAWMRVTGPHPCAFCSMLASRGFKYTREVKVKVHDHCMCNVVPLFVDDDEAYSARDKFFMDNFSEVTKNYSTKNNGKLNAWRRWLTKQYRAHRVPDQDVYGPARPST